MSFGQVWHQLGLRRKFISFEGEVVDPVVDADVEASDPSIDPASPVNEEVEP
jgi:hypothetical protein